MLRRPALLALLALPLLRPRRAHAQGSPAPEGLVPEGLVTMPSRHGPAETLDRFEAAVRAEGWTVFTRIDHAAAAAAAGLQLRPRTVVVFGNPRAGTPAMAKHATLALDLPLRVLVWEDDQGRTAVSRNSGAYMAEAVYARHGMTLPPQAVQGMEALLARLVETATR
jgi:uncharacterized protein (DUF302 family)